MKTHMQRVRAIVDEASKTSYVLNSRDAQIACMGEGRSMRLVHDGDVVQDLGESKFSKDIEGSTVEHRKVKLDEGFVGWVIWEAFEPTDKLSEETPESSAAPWVVRGGETVLVRPVKGSRDSWTQHVMKKVTYFRDDELVSKPDRGWNERSWVFQRGNWRVAIRDDQFFSKPEL